MFPGSAGFPDGAVFIPVGPNLPFPETPAQRAKPSPRTIGVFSVTGGEKGAHETQIILDAVKYAAKKIGTLRLSVFGRHAEIREAALRDGLREFPVDISVEGVVSPELVVNRFANCDLLLFVRGGISSRRSSAIAGIAAGLPVIAYANAETAPPITEAGVLLTDPQHPQQLSEMLARVLTDDALREQLVARSRAAYQSYFSWSSIAVQYLRLLNTA
jgi:glycosyltransferase involved in cell wall biosynthesis